MVDSRLRRAFWLALATVVLPIGCAAPVQPATPTPMPTATATAVVAPTASPTVAVVATATPAASPTSVATATASTAPPTQSPAASPTASPATTTVAKCPADVIRGFGMVYSQQSTVANRLGCAQAREAAIRITVQSFQNGKMLSLAGASDVIVLQPGGVWASYPATYQDGETLPSVSGAPAGTLAPQRAFGKLWRDNAGVKQALGWATAEQQGVDGASQGFVGGRMLWTPDKTIYVLYSDHTWQSFPDNFVG